MILTTALKVMGMTAKALTKKYGSRAVGLSKRIKAGQVVDRAKKGGRLLSSSATKKRKFSYAKTSPKRRMETKRAMERNDARRRAKQEFTEDEKRDMIDSQTDYDPLKFR